jgi:hypothetical protein
MATVVAGAALIAASGVLLALGVPSERGTWTNRASRFVLAGSALLVAGTLVPFNGGGNGAVEAVLPADGGLNLIGLVPLGSALAAVVALLAARRGRAELAAGILLGVGSAAGFFFLEAIYPVFGRGEDVSFAPGAVLGLAGAVLVVVGAVSGLRPHADAAEAVH